MARPSMPSADDRFDSFVKHPRFGKRPRTTGLNPHKGNFHWHSPASCRIPNTAIAADAQRQRPATVHIAYYFDVERVCRNCGRNFIFFAEEQRHWYEELQFKLEADCVRCFPCRAKLQQIVRLQKRYEQLLHAPTPSAKEDLELADCCLQLIEQAIFDRRQTEHVRMLLNRLPADRRFAAAVAALRARVRTIEEEGRA